MEDRHDRRDQAGIEPPSAAPSDNPRVDPVTLAIHATPAFVASAVEFVEAGAPDGIDVNAQWRAYEARIPLRRLADPDDVGRTALFLASGLGSYLNGAQIVVDGGLLTA